MLQTLQIGRALAALAVCTYHLSIMFGEAKYGGVQIFSDQTRQGNLGVDFFFALSGFIIMFVHHSDINQSSQLRTFASKRFFRVYPVYWIVTAGLLLGAVLTSGRSPRPGSIADWATTISLFHINDFRVPIGPAWTLFHEVLFYVVFALLIFRKNIGICAFIVWLALLLINNFNLALITLPSAFAILENPINISFFAGIGAFFIYQHVSARGGWIATIGGAILFVLVLQYRDLLGHALLFRGLLGASFMLMLGGLSLLERDGLKLKLPLLGAIGNASFSLYLTHENVQSSVMKIVYAKGWLGPIDAKLWYGIVMVVCVAFALFFYVFIEKPLVALGRRKFVRVQSNSAQLRGES